MRQAARKLTHTMNVMKTNAFTLIELILVLVLIGLGLAIAGPPLAEGYWRSSARGAVDEFVTTHELARATAVRYGRVARLRIDAAGGRFWAEVDTGRAAGRPQVIGAVKRVGDLGLTMTSNRSTICFDSRGLPTTRGACESADARVVFSAESWADTVEVTLLGKVLR